LAAERKRHKLETAALEERLEGLQVRRESEARLYEERLAELERGRVADKKAIEEELERRLAEGEEEKARLKDRIAELQDALEESGALEAELREALEAMRARGEDRQQGDEHTEEEIEDLERHLEKSDATRILAEEWAADLKARLRKVEEENQQLSEELRKALEGLRRASDPDQRLRAGISLFNASEHTRTVASISKALGLPKVRVDSGDGSSAKPVITFFWSDMAWRRYVSDPTEGVEEPRVYLVESGDDPSGINRSDREPNARMDAQGRLILGVRAQ
ncbi:MAG TPA: hypothetical protein VFE09_04610, partial [Rubrobacteraceae bacterium]|nr:hypothetical protein [Rubrobacteraceae bacterium]